MKTRHTRICSERGQRTQVRTCYFSISGLVLTRYAGSGIKGVGSRIRRVGCGITAPGSGITSRGIGINSFFRNQGSGCSIFVGSGSKMCHNFGINDKKFGSKHGINNETTYLFCDSAHDIFYSFLIYLKNPIYLHILRWIINVTLLRGKHPYRLAITSNYWRGANFR